jgi:hypothetical protein
MSLNHISDNDFLQIEFRSGVFFKNLDRPFGAGASWDTVARESLAVNHISATMVAEDWCVGYSITAYNQIMLSNRPAESGSPSTFAGAVGRGNNPTPDAHFRPGRFWQNYPHQRMAYF